MKGNWLCPAASISLIAAILSGCGGGGTTTYSEPPIYTRAEAMQHGAWTILVYLDADNDLESSGITNFNQMELAGSTRNVRVIVQMDRKDGHDPDNESWTDTRRYLITRDSDARVMHSVRLDDEPLGELDMGDWRTLRDFVDWGTAEFPADHYCLIIWDHGTGWHIRGAVVGPDYKYVVIDDTSATEMNVTEIPQALARVGIDVVAFDACLMQQLETAYELRNSAAYMVGSAAPEPSPGYSYSTVLRRVNGDTTPAELCRVIVEEYALAYPPPIKGITHSAVDLRVIADVADATSTFAQVLIDNAAAHSAELREARESSLNYSTATGGAQRYSLDLLDYAGRCASSLGRDAEAAYATLNEAMDGALVAETHNPDTPGAHGLALYLPDPPNYAARYSLLGLADDTLWDDWIRSQLQ